MLQMNDTKKANNPPQDNLYRSFLKGMSEVLVLGKKPEINRFYTWSDAFNRDISYLREDFYKVLIKAIKNLPPEKKTELKNKLLEMEPDSSAALEGDYCLK